MQKDGTPGYILTRALEANGRPVAFAFAGVSPDPDGADDVFLKPPGKKSLNFRSVENGHAYPLVYDTLLADLRDSLATAARNARRRAQGPVGVGPDHQRREGGPTRATSTATASCSRSCSVA